MVCMWIGRLVRCGSKEIVQRCNATLTLQLSAIAAKNIYIYIYIIEGLVQPRGGDGDMFLCINPHVILQRLAALIHKPPSIFGSFQPGV